jgi:hypothetical protein
MLNLSPEDALKGLRGAALDKAYRVWAKRLHPDGSDGDNESFLRLQDAYQAEKAAEKEMADKPEAGPPPQSKPKTDSFDPWVVVRETGHSGKLSPEDCLFAALERWRQVGSPSAKPVASASVGARNRRILRTILHWASLVDPALARDFALLVRYDAGPLRTTATSRAERDAKHKLEAGIDDLLRYREEGRPITAALARERLEAAKETVELHGLPRPEIGRIADWLIKQTGAEGDTHKNFTFVVDLEGRKAPGGEP